MPDSPVQERPLVLIADDEPAILEVTRRMAESLGWRAFVADTLPRALELFRDHADRIACVMLDLHWPDSDALGAMTELRTVRPGVRIVLMTGDDGHAFAPDGGLHAPDHVLEKPFLIHDLECALDRRAHAA